MWVRSLLLFCLLAGEGSAAEFISLDDSYPMSERYHGDRQQDLSPGLFRRSSRVSGSSSIDITGS